MYFSTINFYFSDGKTKSYKVRKTFVGASPRRQQEQQKQHPCDKMASEMRTLARKVNTYSSEEDRAAFINSLEKIVEQLRREMSDEF